MRRREFITLLASATAAWPPGARAQPAMPTVGFLHSGSSEFDASRVTSFRQGLSETGYVEGQNVKIEFRWAGTHNDRLPELAAELVHHQVAVIAVVGSSPAALAAKAATTMIPIVFSIGADPVQLGLVASLARPGGNVTGITTLTVELGAKQLELLHELVPTATVVALLVNPTNPIAETESRNLQTAARALGLNLHVLHASSERDFDTLFASLIRLRVGALVIGADALFTSRHEQLSALALRHAVPAIFQYREFVVAGGLVSYGTNVAAAFRQVGVYSARILKGDKPSDLPVQQVTKVDLCINLKTARALGITVPLSLLSRADEVIE